jgi:hypothetical protein
MIRRVEPAPPRGHPPPRWHAASIDWQGAHADAIVPPTASWGCSVKDGGPVNAWIRHEARRVRELPQAEKNIIIP